MQLRVLTADQVRSSIDMKGAIDAMGEAFAQLSAGKVQVPLRHRIDTPDGVTVFMPAALQDGGLGIKVASIYLGNAKRGLPVIHAVVLVLDPDSGAPEALLEGGFLTAFRTGAASGLATDLLARKDASILTIFGAGGQAAAQIEAVRAVRPIAEVRIVSRTDASANRLAALLHGVGVKVMNDRRAAVRDADVIVTATTSRTPVFDGNDVRPGTHINAVGAFTADTREVDSTVVRSAYVVVDSRTAARSEAGDVVIPLTEGAIGEDWLTTELGEIATGAKPGRTSDDQITLFKSVGIAVQDVAIARAIVRRAGERGIGTVIELGS